MKYYVNRPTSAVTGMDEFFNDLFGDGSFSRKFPPVDVYETDKAYVIEAEVAGYKQEEISLSVDKHVLTISASLVKKVDNNEEKKEDKKYVLREIGRSSFYRSFTLPDDVDEEKIEAETKDGVLLVYIPKKEKSQRGKIAIKIK